MYLCSSVSISVLYVSVLENVLDQTGSTCLGYHARRSRWRRMRSTRQWAGYGKRGADIRRQTQLQQAQEGQEWYDYVPPAEIHDWQETQY